MGDTNTFTMIVEGYETEHDEETLQDKLDELFADSAESATVMAQTDG